MKKIFNIVTFVFILAFTLTLSLLSNTTLEEIQYSSNRTDYIREVKSETIFLISNNTLQEKITSRLKQNNLGHSSILKYLQSISPNNLFFDKDWLSKALHKVYILQFYHVY